jgi:holo-[acyl-carrier protein] synthase
MPPRPFPYPLRIGNDICSVARVRSIVARVNNTGQHHALDGFLRRVLTDREQAYFWTRFGPRPQISTKLDAAAEFLAGRYVARI